MKALGLFLMVAFAAVAQIPTFEAVSIKANRSLKSTSSVRLAKGRVSMDNVSLQKIILNAYGIPEDRVYMVAGADWLATEHFDIEATFPGDTPQDRVRQMLQSMLADRFRMTSHREVKQLPMYSLVVAKNG